MANHCSNSLKVEPTNSSKKAKEQLRKFVSDAKTEGDILPFEYAELYREFYIQERFDKLYRDNAVRYVNHLEMSIVDFMRYVAYEFNYDKSRNVFITGNRDLSMNNIFPCPKELLDFSDEEYSKLSDKEKETYKKLIIKKYGHKNAYDWRLSNWGCRSDIYDVDFEDDGYYITYNFDTAWSPADEFVKNICEKYPLLNFNLNYEEPGCNFEGDLIIIAGEIDTDETREYSGNDIDNED